MKNFFDHLDPAQRMELEALSRLAHNTRQARAGLLAYHGVEDEASLRERIVAGTLGEHPGWEHYLGARVLGLTREAAREAMSGRPAALDGLPMMRLREAIDARFADALAASPEAKLDAIELSLKNGLVLTLHVATPDEYSFAWHAGDPARRAIIDTAPCHLALPGAPAHCHYADGRVAEDRITRAGADPVDNACALLEALIARPRLALED